MSASSEARLLRALSGTIDRLREARLRYAVIGAWARGAWGIPRATADVDFMVPAGKGGLEGVARRLTRVGLIPDVDWHAWNPTAREVMRRFRFRGVRIDIVLPQDEHDRRSLARRRRRRLGNRHVWLVSPEDFVLQKIKVGRPRDVEDALAVLGPVRCRLDFRYLRRWAGKLGVSGELEYLLSRR